MTLSEKNAPLSRKKLPYAEDFGLRSAPNGFTQVVWLSFAFDWLRGKNAC
jgi:hypothetical protein